MVCACRIHIENREIQVVASCGFMWLLKVSMLKLFDLGKAFRGAAGAGSARATVGMRSLALNQTKDKIKLCMPKRTPDVEN